MSTRVESTRANSRTSGVDESTPVTDAWPVAEIPTPPVANHPTGEQIPLRWPHHGDLRILVDVDTLEAFVVAADLHALAELDAEADLHPSIRPSTTWAKRPGAPLIEHYTLADAVAVLEHNPTHQTRELLAWMRVQIPDVLHDDVIDHAVGLETFCTAYSVRQAAMILDRDPAVNLGRTRLFEHLERFGWTYRDIASHWRPTALATRHHLVTVRDVTVMPGTRAAAPYPQLMITPTGLAELRRLLHALHPDTPATLPAPELLDI